jgi:translocation and assembly module TamB
MARRLLWLLAALTAIAAAAAAGAATWLLYTEAGLAWAAAQIQRATDGALVLENARGVLSREALVSRILYSEGGTTVEARDVALRLSPLSLAVLSPRITALRCAELDVTLAPGGEPARLPDTLALPLRISVTGAQVARVRVKSADGVLELSDIAFSYSGSGGGHHLRDAAVEAEGVRFTGQADIGAAKPYPVRAAVKAQRAAAPAADASAELSGTLERLSVAAQVASAGARVELQGTLAPYAPLPVESLKASLAALDLRAFDTGLPRTDFAGTLELAAANGALAGGLQLANRVPGRYDSERLPIASLRAAVRTDLASVQLADLRVDLGAAGAVSGSGTLAPDRVALALKTSRLDLARVHGRLRATRLAGSVNVTGGTATQSIKADLAEGDIRIALTAERSGTIVTLRDARARARGGQASGRGRIELSGAQAFTVEARLTRFDPAAWGDFPPGAINGRVTAKGTLAETPAIDAQFALDPSRLRDAPLAGGGRMSLRGERLADAHADLELDGNRAEVRGALGGRDDVLTARVQAPRLAAVHPGWAGSAEGTVQLNGRLREPGVKFDLRGRELELFGWRSAALSAKGEYSPAAGAPLRLEATATGLSAPQLTIDQARLDVDGTQAAHVATLRASGKNLDLIARARAGWQTGRGWSGTLEEVENKGQVAVKLEAPVALEAAPGRLRVGAIAARVAGGRLDAKESRYEQGRLVSDGRFNDLPVSTALALAGVSPAAGGTLRMSGSWAFTSTPRWNGTVSIRRESGDVAVDADNALPLGLETLTLDARMVDDRIEFRGALRARVASGRVEGTVLPVATPEGERLAASSPLKFAASFEIARLAALSSLTAATVQVDGRLRATLTGAGTLADPLINGTLEGDALSIELPQEGVELRRGELRAELAGHEVRVQSFSIRGSEGVFKAQGTLAHGAEARAALDWEAERLGLLARPDRRLVVSGRGKAALDGAKVSLSGELRADEGLLEISPTTLPAPGDDVVIVGRQEQEKETTRLKQVTLDLALDFGERFRVRGRGLDTLVRGQVRVQTGPAGNFVAKGTVRTERGTYTAFGQTLDLERGSLIFSGPMANPAIDIRAMRKMPTVHAGVEVAGTLQSPFVRVVSDPPMPEHEALSWLVLGEAPGDTKGSEFAVPGSMARTVGLDSIGMRGGGTTGGSQAVTFGKRLSEDIYVVYEQSLGATANVLKLDYSLSRRVLLRAETGEVSALGLFYRWAFD